MRRFAASWLAAVAALALLASSAAAEDELRLTPAGGARFPDRAYVLSLPTGTPLGQADVVVRENGEPVDNVTVVPASAAGTGQFAVVLVIDASNSMRGDAIKGAVEAARVFAAQRAGNQLMAIVMFNTESTVPLPFTTDQKKIDAVLSTTPPLARGTRIYDAVGTAVDMLVKADVAAGSVIVLSDGADTGSAMALDDVAATADSRRIRIFTVGLRSRAFESDSLERLAQGAGGEYSEATSSADLAPIFNALGAKLASEYLLRYKSPAGPKTNVHVSVSVRGFDGIARSEYDTPALGDGVGAPYRRSVIAEFWRSALGMLVASGLSALLLAFAFVMILRPRARTVRRRLADFVSMPVSAEERQRRGARTGVMLARAEKSVEGTRWWTRFKEDLELAGIKTPAVHIVLATVVATMVAMWLLAVLAGSLLFAPLGLAVAFVVNGAIKRRVERKRKLFAEQLPDNLQVLSSALRAGHSLVGALSVVVDDCAEPSQSELRRVIADEQLGVSLEEAFGVVVRRMDNRDLQQVALVASLQHETGGNTAEVLDRVAETVRSRSELRRLVKTLTTQGRMSRWIVSFLPVALLGLITLLNPEYMEPLYSTTIGRVLLGLAGVMVVSGSLVIRRIVDIKV
jgi:tight adherence protein B